jgi:anthranilate/para-aminobenzoate synthase component II
MAPARIVISPGPCTPNEAGISMDVIRRLAGTVCRSSACASGTSAIGQVFGGTDRARAARSMHGKTSKRLPRRAAASSQGLANPFVAARYHSLVIAPEGCPTALEVTAQDLGRRDHGVRVGRWPAPPPRSRACSSTPSRS